MSYVVVAEFRVLDGAVEAFAENMRRHAALSREETGCRLFEVAQDAADPNCFVLFERYDDEAAYVAHRATPHYKRFLDWAPPLLQRKDGQLFQRRSVLAGI
ncbi:MAG TPA: putative quinol monooxygenase [Hyphomicrobiaceae bacterium]|nr:putative quinol monooxygenase [Hyphomicrobiaceae bacterium]